MSDEHQAGEGQDPVCAPGAGFQFGRPQVNAVSPNCCGKPQGCTMTHPECLFLNHPWKREHVFGEPSEEAPGE